MPCGLRQGVGGTETDGIGGITVGGMVVGWMGGGEVLVEALGEVDPPCALRVRGMSVLKMKRNGVNDGLVVGVSEGVKVTVGVLEGNGVGPVGVGNGPIRARSVSAIAVRVLFARLEESGSVESPPVRFHSKGITAAKTKPAATSSTTTRS